MRASMIEEEAQPWTDLALRAGDLCRSLWFVPSSLCTWASRVERAYRRTPRHSLPAKLAATPNFMKAWHLL
jgi:hypothetical protein